MKNKKWAIIGGVIFAILTVVSVVMIVLDAKYSATLEILVAPSAAKITVDGKEYKNGTYKMEPGEVTVKITMDGFITKELPALLTRGGTTKLYTYLIPENESMDWYLEHPEEQMLLNTIGDARAAAASAEYLTENPIVKVLPLIYANYDENWNYTEYRVDGGDFEECEREFCLRVTDTTGGNYEAALELIRENGFSPEDYEIVYQYKPITPLN